MHRFLSIEASRKLLQNIRHASFPAVYEYEKHRIIITDESKNELIHFRLPLIVALSAGFPAPEERPVNYVILLIQSGSCAVGYFEQGTNLDHKVFRAYMVRMKQGKSQIKYLKTKGKSRAGSRVRLSETAAFFENINERLQQYFAAHEIHRIAISCSKTLIPYLFNAKVATPFNKKDPRIFKIPKHIHTPGYDILMDTHQYLLRGELVYHENNYWFADKLLNTNSSVPGSTKS